MTQSVDIPEQVKSSTTEGDVIDHLFRVWDEVVFRIISHHSRSLKTEHLKLPGYFIMNYLYRNGSQNLSKLAEFTGVSRPTITGIVDKLEQHGLVKRVRGNEDRRNIAVELTATACSKVERVYMDRNMIKEELSGALKDKEISDFVKYMEVLSEIIARTSENNTKNNSEGDRNI